MLRHPLPEPNRAGVEPNRMVKAREQPSAPYASS
jgi:hypothetical protein